MATGFGLRPVRHKNGSPYNGDCNMYSVPATDAAAIGVGECVKLVNTMDAAAQLSTVTQAAAGDALIGVVVGIVPNGSIGLDKIYKPASTACKLLVADDPDLIFEVQEDAVGGVVSAANIGAHANADIIVVSATANVNTATGLSKTMLDSSDANAGSSTLKIVGVRRDGTNAGAATAGAVLEVMILEHALRAVDSIT